MCEDLKKFIEENKDMFDKHVVKKIDLPTGGAHDCYISFRDPATSNGAMEFIYIGGYLTIQGDYGNASFTWYNPRNSIEVMAGFAENFGYFWGKQQSAQRCSLPNVSLMEWDSAECFNTVKNYIREYEIEVPDCDWEDKVESWLDWFSFLNRYGDDYFGDEYYDLFEAGYKVVDRAYILTYGFIKAVEALHVKGKL